ncbi:hypothetical protein BPS26883_05128 [Burkholderia pseudomultivorans]|uniref:Uncharacterized protein n=1 Tax=Burkholderia pseudomultivorans TaxID=1207504 RepID=A0A6P2PEJ5_9BURK|nr:hypothetical protein DM80_5577 [Burkholderia multivorans]VWC05826.1 hypothetical protein BPS26883_05128 [Burkholderia pseudomultivorans]
MRIGRGGVTMGFDIASIWPVLPYRAVWRASFTA